MSQMILDILIGGTIGAVLLFGPLALYVWATVKSIERKEPR